jgi:cell division septum initiation protein DivIVA
MRADPRKVEAEAAERAKAATEAVLALAQKLHDEYVAEGQRTRESLISEGQSRRDQVVGEATARQEELVSTGQAKYDELVSAGKAKHDELIAEAEALIAEAQHKRAEVLTALGSERGVLQEEIEKLRTTERDHRAHLRSYLQGQLIKLEQTGPAETS